mgnify:CR=1 FL=1
MYKSAVALAVTLIASATAVQAAGRNHIEIVGSSTVYPFATVVAERFGQTGEFKTPKIESTGSGGGMKLFCAGAGVDTPDITNSSRRIKQSEFDNCQANGVTDVVEVLIGYDGIAIANSTAADQLELTRKELYLALAKDVPNPDGSEAFVANPYSTWNEINESLPATKIEVLGPPPTSGTRDAFAELVLEGGCKQYDFVKALEKDEFKARCHSVREDGAYVEAGENDNLIVQKLAANANALGIFGFSFLEENEDLVQGSFIDGQLPTFETIADGSYPVSRPLYFYVKKAHMGQIPGLEQFLVEFTHEDAWGDEGYLTDKGMIPLPSDMRDEIATAVATATPMTMD